MCYPSACSHGDLSLSFSIYVYIEMKNKIVTRERTMFSFLSDSIASALNTEITQHTQQSRDRSHHPSQAPRTDPNSPSEIVPRGFFPLGPRSLVSGFSARPQHPQRAQLECNTNEFPPPPTLGRLSAK
jgi:hypothetical protein